MANALSITELTDSQASKYATVNLQLKFITTLLVGARDIAGSPPGSPVENGCYIIGSGGNSGVWSTYSENDIMFYFGATWYRMSPVEGLRLWIWDEDTTYHYTGAAWASGA